MWKMSVLETLSKNRTPILLAEIGAYLHLVGRFSKEFIESHVEGGNLSPKFDYQKICSDPAFFEDTGLDKILSDQRLKNFMQFNTYANIGELGNGVSSFCEFIQNHTWDSKPKGLCKILADAHGIVSGIDKSLAGRLENKQRKDYTFRSTVFGYEKEIELLKNPDLKRQLFKELYQILNDIFAEIASNQQISCESYRKFLSTVAKYYPETIGETRRPINEISLYDYAYSITSLVKSNLAKMLVDGWYEPRSKSEWTILSVNLDIPGLLSKGLKIGDIIRYREETEQLFNEIKKFVEYDHPFGNEIYRDGTGIYFSCPTFEKIDEFLKEIIETFLNNLNFDVSLHVGISSRNSRSMTVIANERVKALEKISFPYASGAEHWRSTVINENHENKFALEKCPVCGIRMKLEKDDRCKVCSERYEKRAEVWNKDPKETIWIDEVSDNNDRVAMIVGKFNLNKWLSGELLDTLVSTTFEEWKSENSCLCSKMGIHKIEDLERKFQDMFKNPNLDENEKELLKSLVGAKIDDFNKFWDSIAERDATGYVLNLVDNKEKARHLIKLLFRKHPLFARLRRIWSTTQEFIDEAVKVIKNTFGFSDPRTKRIQLVISPNPSIPKNSTCDVIVNVVRLSPVCIDDTRSIFISTINLEILNKFGKTVEEIAKKLSGQDIKLKTEEEKNWKDFKIIEAKPADNQFQDYLPYIEIYDFPDQFMVLVPAYEAFDIAEKIVGEYEKQFSKVRDRLPFHLGIIAFHRRTPLYIAMDAAKRLMKRFEMPKTIEADVVEMENIEDQELGKCAKLALQIVGREIPLNWIISYSTKDPEKEDLWYPYLRIHNKEDHNRDLSFDYTSNGDCVVHVKEIEKGEKLKIEPSYFKLCYIEESSDRFYVDENFGFIDDIHTIQRLWKFVVDKLKSGIWTVSQLYNFWEELERIKEYNGETFEYFLESSLINILGLNRSSNEFEFLKKAIKDDLFELCLYWNLQVRKEKVGKGD